MKIKLNWGTGIALIYGAFFVVVVTLVIVFSLTEWDLVSKDYYQKEMTYQEQIDKEQRTGQLEQDIKITYIESKKSLYVFFPESMKVENVKGTIHLFRPSDASMDRSYDIVVNPNGFQVLDVKELLPGNWRIKIDWTYGNKDYYRELQMIF